MRYQYTVTNTGLPERPVIIRTHDRAQAISWIAPHRRVTAKCLETAGYGLRRMEERAKAVAQYRLLDGNCDYL